MAKKRFLAILLSVLMLIQAMPMNALAAGVVRSNTLSGETYHTVDFVVGGDTVATQLIESGENAKIETLPENPTLVEHEFTGWKAGETEVTVGTEVNSDLTAEAQFAPLPKYTVTVKYVYTGTDTEVADSVKREYTKYDAVDTINSPTSAAMEIDGGLELVYPVDSVVTIKPAELTADTVIRVEYTLPNVTYTVEHRVVGTEEVIETETLTANNGAIILPEAKTFENYEFASTTQMVLNKDNADSLKGVVYYNPKEYKLNYNSMGGSYVDAKYADYGSEVAVYTTSTGTEQVKTLTCTKTEHTHSDACYTENWWGQSSLNCGYDAHTHGNSCYTTSNVNVTVYDPAPTRTGYTFAGWYLDEACTQAAPQNMTINGETTVYAKWEGKTVNYTVVYLKEVWNNATGAGEYTFAESVTRQAKVGEIVTATDDKNYTYYNPTPAECTSATVAADGSTVVYAKYRLQEYTFEFDLNSNNATLTINGNTYNNTNKYSFTVRLGEDVSSKWPTAANVSRSGYTFYAWDPENSSSLYVSKRFEVAEEMIEDCGDDNKVVFVAEYQSGDKCYVQYWLQNVDGNGYTVEERYSQPIYTNSLTGKALYGFSYDSSLNDHVSNGKIDNVTYDVVYNFYYKRDKFSITYMYKDEELKTINNVYFGADISTDTYTAGPSTMPESVDSEATFAGWYEDPDCTNKYNFSTMPGSNLVLYAKYDLPMKEVTLDLNYEGADNSVYAPIEVKKFETISSANKTLPVPEREGYVFLGWYTKADGGVKFDEAKAIDADTTVYAQWKMGDLSYTVKYLKASDKTAVYTEKTVTSSLFQIGEKYTEKAVTVEGYRVDALEKSTEPMKITGNEIIFYYTERASVGYTVIHQYEDGTEIKKEEKTADAYTERVVAYPIAVEGYYPDADAKVIESLVSDASQNTVTFIYAPYKTAEVTVNHYYQKEAGNTEDYDLVASEPVEKKFLVGDSVSAKDYVKTFEQTTPYDFDHYGKVSYVVVTENHCANGIVIDIYYNIAIFDVTVNYYWNNTETELNDSVVIEDQYFGTTVTADAIAIDGYTPVEKSGSVVVSTSGNVINLYYYKNVTLTANSDTKIYNGQNQTVSGYTCNVADVVFEGIEVSATRKNVGTETAAFEETVLDTVDTTKKYIVTEVKSGTLTINKKDASVASEDLEKVYDGTALTNGETALKVKGFVEGEGVVPTFTGSQTVVGSSANAFTYAAQEGTDLNNYEIDKTEGTLTVTALTNEVVVTIKENSGTATFDGEEHTVTGYEIVSISNTLYTEADFTFSGNATVKATDAGTYNMELKPADFANISKNFANVEFVIVDGTLEIAKRSVTLTSATDEKVYDGTALTNSTVTAEGFVDGEGAAYNVTGTQTEVGSSSNAFTYTLNENTKADNYEITKTEGTLTVTALTDEVTVTIKENSGTATFDGEEHTVTGYEIVSIDNDLYTEADFSFSGDATVKGTDAGTYNMELKPADFTNNSKNITNVKFVIEDGTLEVTPAAVTITANTAAFEYDGAAHSDDGYEVEGLFGEDAIAAVVEGTITYPSQSPVTNVVKSHEFTVGKAANYTVSYVNGELTMTYADAVEISIIANSADKTYDGTALTADGYTLTVDGETIEVGAEGVYTFANGDVLTVVVEGTVTDVDEGTVANKITSWTIMNGNEDVAAAYAVNAKDGELKINARKVTLTSESATKPYDGIELTKPVVAVTEDGFVAGEVSDIKATGAITTVGKVTNTITFTANDSYKASNYAITMVEGELEITTSAKALTVVSGDTEYMYNGEVQKYDVYTVTYAGEEVAANEDGSYTLPTGDTLTITSTSNVKNVSDTAAENNTFTYVLSNETSYGANFTYSFGKITIIPRTVVMTSATDEKTYDGKALTNNEVTETGDGFVTGEGATYDVTGSQLDLGSSANEFTYTLNEGTLAENYAIETVEGTLTVSAIANEIVITANSNEKIYDGKALTDAGYTFTQNVLVDGDVLTAVVEGTITNVGTAANVVTSYKVMRGETDVTANYTFGESVDGTLTITKRSVTLTSATDEKIYDGTALTNDTVTAEGFVDGEGAVYNVTGTQTEVGASKNAFTYTLNENTKADNYTIKTVEGTLTVTALTDEVVVTITEHSGEYTYDGTEKTVTGYDVEISNALYTEADFTFSGDATVKGTEAGTYNMELKAEDFTNNSKNITNVKFVIVDGTLTIKANPVKIVITANSNSKVYDGTALTDAGYTYTGELAEDDKLVATTKGDITNVGTEVNVIDTYAILDENGNDVTASYSGITTVDGTLTITKRSVTITADSNAKEYDGTALTDDGWKDTAPENVAEGDAVESVTVTGSQLDLGSSANVASNAVIKRGEDDVTANYAITYVDGTLTINAKSDVIVITADSDSKIYDGTPLTNAGYTFTQNVLVEGDVLTAVVEGTITNVGTAANVVTSYKVMRGETDVTANYTFGESVDGTLTITKRAVTMTSANDEKEYDGTALTNDTVTVTGFVTGEGAQITVTGSQTKVGESENTFEYALNEGTLAENYDITVVFGTLKVTQTTKALEIKSLSKEWMYDGKAHTNPEYVVTFGGETIAQENGKWTLPTGDVVEITMDATATVTDVADSDTENNTYTYTLENADQYADVSTHYGDLTVIVRKVTLTSASDAREYNGNALTNSTVTVSGDKFAEGEGAAYTVTGSQTLVGTSDNKFTYTLNENTKAGNYEITVVFGTLTVTDRTNPYEIEVVANSGEFKYDGAAKTVEGFETLTFVVEGNTYTVEGLTAKNTQTNAGEYVVAIEGTAVVRDVNGNDVTKQFAVTETDGKLTITKRELTMTSADASKTYDATALTNSTVTVSGEGFAEGEGAAYDVTGSQTLVGSSKNEFTYTLNEGTLADNYVIKTVFGTLTVTDEGVDHSLVINKTHPDGEYDLDDEVTFTITVKNIYAEAKKIVITEIDGVTITGESVFENVAPGATVTTTATWNVTEEAILAGEFVNTATATVGDKEYKANDTVNPVAPNGHLTADKITTSEPANGTSYALGETISYKITVTNDGNLTVKNVEVIDALVGLNETIAVMKPGDVKTFEVTYTVTEDDVLAGSVKNEVTVKGNGSDGKDPEGGDDVEDPIDKPNPSLKVEKVTTSTPANGETYALGETIKYQITVTNDGNLTISNVVVTDELTGDEWTVEAIEPGKNVVFTAEYTVTEDDILAGSVENVATATGDNKSDEPTEVVPGDTEDPTDEPNPHLTVVKTTTSTPANGEDYVLGETITYSITVTNDGNLTISNVVVTDEFTGDTWNVESIAPGAVETFTTSHVVNEEDILAGSVKNVATAAGDNKSDEPTEVIPGETEDPTEEKNGHLTVDKVTTSTPANGETYALGETISYKITVTNDGNLTITGITVTDELTEDEWTVESLIPGESKEFTAEYTVTEKDILNGKVVNVATAKGTSPDPENPDVPVVPGEEEDETDDIDATLNVTKTSDADEMTGLGDTITYTITVTNEGNVPYTNLVVDDQLDGVEILPGEAYTIDENGDAVIAELAVGETVVITATYVVTEADLVTETESNPVITNKVAVEGDPIPNPKDDEPVVPGGEAEVEDEILPYTLTINYWFDKVGGEIAAETVVEQHFNGQTYLVVSPVIEHYAVSLAEVTGVMNGDITVDVIYTKIYHRLIVNYVYEDGTTAATAYNKRVAEGAKYNIVSPYIEGFTADIKVISGTMPGNSLEFTVTYVPDMYDVPMNIGNTTVNCGDCFE